MRRAGHKSPAAALRYQHATEDRDRAIAEALAELGRRSDAHPIGADDARHQARNGRAIENTEDLAAGERARIVPLTRKFTSGGNGTMFEPSWLADLGKCGTKL